MVTPLLPEPGVWTGVASANVCRGAVEVEARRKSIGARRRRVLKPHQEAGYTSALVTVHEPSHPVAIGRDPYTSTHDPKRTSSSARPGPVAAGSAVAVNSSVETCNVDSYRVRAIATLTQIKKSMTARSPASEVDP